MDLSFKVKELWISYRSNMMGNRYICSMLHRIIDQADVQH